jgi:hypothetical protein
MVVLYIEELRSGVLRGNLSEYIRVTWNFFGFIKFYYKSIGGVMTLDATLVAGF